MKHLATFFFCLPFLSFLLAQTDTVPDYTLFRPGVQYLYQDYNNQNSLGIYYSRLVGQKLAGLSSDPSSPSPLYRSIQFNPTTYALKIAPSFAGYHLTSNETQTVLYFSDTSTDDRLLLLHAAMPGEEWQAAPSIKARVDSIRHEMVWDLPDSVKYISFSDARADTLLTKAPIRISRSYGLLQGVCFWDMRQRAQPLKLVSSSMPVRGPQLISPEERLLPPAGTKFSLEEIRSMVPNNEPWYFAVKQRNLRVIDSQVNGDNITVNYEESFASWKIGQELDGTPYDGFREDSLTGLWRYDATYLQYFQYQPGEIITTEDGLRLLYADLQPCFGVGLGLTAHFSRIDSTTNELIPDVFDETPSGLFFQHAVGGYGYLGAQSYFDRRLHAVSSPTLECGKPFDLSVSNRKLVDDERIRVFPNPASSVVFLQIPLDLRQTEVQLYAATGQLILSTPWAVGDRRLEVGNLPNGIYTVNIRNADRLGSTRRLLINR
ncbi:MAG: T9SS type A sorting domain-containing protein [Bacteroidota bacterium]